MQLFKDLNLPDAIQSAIEKMGFEKQTPIQTAVYQDALEQNDLIASAQTGSGKTVAFCLPVLLNLIKDPKSTALVLAPTRELALQIDEVWKSLTIHSRSLSSVCLIGGVAMQPQERGLRKQPRMIIATPGRLLDHLNRGTAKLQMASYLVLDEADRMLDMGFRPQLTKIRARLPKDRQTLLFSATWNSEMDQLAKEYLTEPKRIAIGTVSKTAATISQRTVNTTVHEKLDALLNEINAIKGQILIFARTQKRTDRLGRSLDSFGLKVEKLHGGRSQGQRKSALKAFSEGTSRIMVATDIAARGIDVSGIAAVINFDLPQNPEDYVHRIGRTGRAGLTGEAITMLTPEDRSDWRDVIALLKKSGSALPKGLEVQTELPSIQKRKPVHLAKVAPHKPLPANLARRAIVPKSPIQVKPVH